LGAYRQTREQDRRERTTAYIEGVRTLCYEIVHRALQGKTTGLVIVESQGGEQWKARSTGDLGTLRPDDQARLVRSVEWLADAVSDTVARKQKP
jgi:hypothetical protein